MRATLLIALAVTLTATAANAKGPSSTVVCGRSACLTFTDRDEITYQLLDTSGPFSLRSRPRPAAFYRVAFHFPPGQQYDWSFLFVPSRRMIRVTTSGGMSTYWRSAPKAVTQAFATISETLRPFPASRHWRGK